MLTAKPGPNPATAYVARLAATKGVRADNLLAAAFGGAGFTNDQLMTAVAANPKLLAKLGRAGRAELARWLGGEQPKVAAREDAFVRAGGGFQIARHQLSTARLRNSEKLGFGETLAINFSDAGDVERRLPGVAGRPLNGHSQLGVVLEPGRLLAEVNGALSQLKAQAAALRAIDFPSASTVAGLNIVQQALRTEVPAVRQIAADIRTAGALDGKAARSFLGALNALSERLDEAREEFGPTGVGDVMRNAAYGSVVENATVTSAVAARVGGNRGGIPAQVSFSSGYLQLANLYPYLLVNEQSVPKSAQEDIARAQKVLARAGIGKAALRTVTVSFDRPVLLDQGDFRTKPETERVTFTVKIPAPTAVRTAASVEAWRAEVEAALTEAGRPYGVSAFTAGLSPMSTWFRLVDSEKNAKRAG